MGVVVQSMRGNAQEGSGPVNGLGLFRLLSVSRRLAGLSQGEFGSRGRGGELACGNGSAGEDGDDVVADLSEAAIDKVAVDRRADPSAKLAIAEAGDDGRAARHDAKLAVEYGQGDEFDHLVKQRLFGRDDHALELAVPIGAEGACGHRTEDSQRQAEISKKVKGAVDPHPTPAMLAGHLLGLFLGHFDRADVEERTLGEVVPLAVADLTTRANRVGQRGVLTRLVGEDFGDVERL